MNDCKPCKYYPCGYKTVGGRACLSYTPKTKPAIKAKPQPARKPDMPDYLL